jgi:hypothetical protein
MAARPQNIQTLTVSEKYGGLIFSHNELCPKLDLCGSFFWVPMDNFSICRINPFDDFHKL